MIKVVIIEDEIPARNKLKRFISELELPVELVAEIDTVEAAVEVLKNSAVDLIFSDIELLDGNAFEIYDQISITCPIIFITAYDQFWMNAFESNGIEYLLKPFTQDRFKKAWDKFLMFKKSDFKENEVLTKLQQLLSNNQLEKESKKRFTVNSHGGIYFLNTKDIVFFEADEGIIFAVDIFGKKHLLNKSTLKDIEALLNPSEFFRINRSQLVHKQHVERVERYNKNTLAIQMKGFQNHLITSQGNSAAFRKWAEE
ncbi:LytTR family DNA-binding domain-containing protein [Chryseobacterium sp. Marseille-Q3244]|uniref:LytR/AlgR family response regulator transcription factor n=1 Tax=Chryseobacterium sp. Marseille-Q3244 TaxID=2758092 RepID=UPI002023EDE6|nr:LytTR family DNA-binding domain-containing protein [Chryseobacterium sp. Marseille-Q3244]